MRLNSRRRAAVLVVGQCVVVPWFVLLLVVAEAGAREHTLPGLKHLLASENTITFPEEVHQPLAVGHNIWVRRCTKPRASGLYEL